MYGNKVCMGGVRFRVAVAVLAALLPLAGCGGSGASATGGTPSPPSGSTLSPADLPAITGPKQPGTTTAGLVDEATAAPFADDVFLASQFLSAVAQQEANGGATGPYSLDKTENGGVGGSVTITTAIDANGNGWLQDVFSQYQDAQNGPIQNGTLIVLYKSVSGHNGAATTLGMSDYRENQNGTTFIYNGRVDITSAEPLDFDANLSVDTDRGGSLVLSHVQVQSTYFISGSPTFSITGKLFDSSLGWITMKTPSPVSWPLNATVVGSTSFPDVFPHNSGDMEIVGANGANLHVQSLGPLFVWLGLDKDGSGTVDEGARLVRTTGLLDDTSLAGAKVESLPEIAADVQAGQPVQLDARYSYASAQFISYDWSLVAAPPSSKIDVSGSGPTLAFQPDVPGGYTVALTVSTGGSSVTDYVAIDYAGGTAGSNSSATLFKVPSFIEADIGQHVKLDARASPDLTDGSWSLTVPEGSKAKLSSATALEPGFTPDVSGIYVAIYCDVPSSGCVSPPKQAVSGYGVAYAQTTTIEVGMPMTVHFGPAELLASLPSSLSPSLVFAGNVGGTGRDGLAVAGFDSTALSDELYEFPATGSVAGGFAASQQINLAASPVGLLQGDLNGDGIPDLVDTAMAHTWLSPAYSASSIAGSPGGAAYNSDVIGTIGSQDALVIMSSTNSVGKTYPDPTVYLGTSGGLPVTPIASPSAQPFDFGEVSGGIALGDIDGDGHTDLIMATSDGDPLSPHDRLWVFHGNGDGTFTYVATYTLIDFQAPGHRVFIADFDGDGKPDIAVDDGNGEHLFSGDGLGGFTDEGVKKTGCGNGCGVMHLNGGSEPMLYGLGCSVEGILTMTMVFPNASSAFGADYAYTIPNACQGAISAIGDFNGDGLTDLYVVDGGAVLLFPGLRGDGTLGVMATATRTATTRAMTGVRAVRRISPPAPRIRQPSSR